MPQKIGEWQYKLVDSLNGGLNVSVVPDKLEDHELIQASNILLRKAQIEIDSGYITFADTVVGYPQASFQFFRNNGTAELVCVTTLSFYKYNSTHNQWQLVSDGTDTTINGDQGAGTTNLLVASSTGFTTGDLVGVTLDNGSQHKTTVSNVPDATHITLTAGIPVGRTAEDGDAVVKGVDLAGDDDYPVCILTAPSHDWCVFTNNADPIKRYDGTTCETMTGQPSSGNFRCQWLALYNGALFVVNTEEGGQQYPQRVRWTERGDFTDWNEAVNYTDLYDEADYNQEVEILGPYVIVYRERSIARGEYIGSGGLTYDFQTVLRGEGVLSPGSVVDLGDRHLFVGNTNIYAYRGGFDVEPVGDKIFYRLFGSTSVIDPENRKRSFMFYVEELDEVWMFFPQIGSEFCDYMVRMLVADETFAERFFADPVRGYGFYQKSATLTWDDLVGTWDEQTWQWDSRVTVANAPTTHLCGAQVSQVFEYDFVASLDNDDAIAYTVETKDFLLPGRNFRFDMWEADMTSAGTLVQYSLNGGQSWDTLGTVSAANRQRVRLFKQFVGDRIRFRLTGQGQFEMGWMAFDYKHESLW